MCHKIPSDKLTLLFLLSLFSGPSFSNTEHQIVTIFSDLCLKMREQATTSSPSISCIPFGKKVEIRSKPYIIKPEKWYKTNYNNKNGYLLGKYLIPNLNLSKNALSAVTAIMLEGAHCRKINYSPHLNWYGIYPTDDKFKQKLIKLDITLKHPSALIEERSFAPSYAGENYQIDTNKAEPSLFIFGTSMLLQEGLINGFTMTSPREDSLKGEFLYPEQNKILTTSGINSPLFIKAKEAAHLKEDKNIMKSYEIEVSDKPFTPWNTRVCLSFSIATVMTKKFSIKARRMWV